MFDENKGWIAFWGVEVPEGIEIIDNQNGLFIIDRGLHKFPGDEICAWRKDAFYWLDGFVLNKNELINKYEKVVWEDAFIKASEKEDFLIDFRGGFSGFIQKKDKYILFNDHVGNHAVYYYFKNNIIIISTSFYYIIELLKYNKIPLTFHEQAGHYMLEHGFMIDDSTFVKEILRVLPGRIIEINTDGSIEETQYYEFKNDKVKADMTEDEAIELIDHYFTQAVEREYQKDVEYGYNHLVDLSGGLDSRMTAWVGHALGYTDQVNFTYCRNGYLDYTIAQKVAEYLKHPFYYMPLDDFKWILDIDEIVKKNNGAAIYSGITGGYRFLKQLNCDTFGIEHTGMVGDVILSTFFEDEAYNFSKPTGHEKTYSKLVEGKIPLNVLNKYSNKELFVMNTREFLGMQSTYFIRRNYVEVSSPFLDVDFLDAVFTMPFQYRKKHYIYMKWLEKKYPDSTEFGWETWYGVKPKNKNRQLRKIRKWQIRIIDKMRELCGKPKYYAMAPEDFWYKRDKEIRQWMEEYFRNSVSKLIIFPELYNNLLGIFESGNVSEKTQAMTVTAMAKIII